MLIHVRALALTTALTLSLSSCGDDNDDKKDAAPATKYGEIKTSLLDSTEVRTADLLTSSCTSNADSGLFSGLFTGTQGEKLDIKIKDFTKTPRTYTCLQAETNRDGDLGEKYSGCAIEFTIPGATGGFNTYSTYRTVESMGAFTFSGACTVTTTYSSPTVTLVVSCANLIQTQFNNSARNPISPTETGTVAGTTSASCTI